MPLLLLLSVLLFSSTDIDWTKAQSEAVQLLQELIRIDTTNPPGNELKAARHIQKVLEAEGIETRCRPGSSESLRAHQRRWQQASVDPAQSYRRCNGRRSALVHTAV